MRISDWSSDVCSSDLLKVLLVEKDDLAQHTSSASSKLIHGGLRYLEYYEFRLVREALKEREILLQTAPHIVRPLSFVLPHARGMRPWWMVRAGLLLYRLLAWGSSLPRPGRSDYRAPLKPEAGRRIALRSEEHTSELQSLMRISYSVFCL